MIQRNRTIKKTPIIILSLVIGLGILYGVFAYSQQWPPFTAPSTAPSTSLDTYNGEKAKSDTASSEQTKDEGTKQSPDTGNSTSKHTVPVGIAFAGVIDEVVEVRAFVLDVVEGDGTCTATFTTNGATITEHSEAFVDASTSVCQPIQVPVERFSASDTWMLAVSYSSPNNQGSSSKIEVSLR